MDDSTVYVRAELKPHETHYKNYYAKSFELIAHNIKEIAPSNDCKFNIDNSRLFRNHYPVEGIFDFDYSFSGTLNVTIAAREEVNSIAMAIYIYASSSSKEIEGIIVFGPFRDPLVKYKGNGRLDLSPGSEMLELEGRKI
jgi:hypothetical protein